MTDSYRGVTRYPTLGTAWTSLLGAVLGAGDIVRDDDRKLLELRNVACTIDEVDENDPVIVEHADATRIELMCRKYSSTELVAPYPVSYGGRIRDIGGVDQVAHVVARLIAKPETKSACITLHLPADDYIPCLTGLDLKLRHGLLEMSAIYRSQNVYASQPGNLIALRRLQREVASRCETGLGSVSLHVMSAHVYDHDWEPARQVVHASQG